MADNFFDPNSGNWAQRVHPARDGGRLIVTTGLNDGTTRALSTLSLPEALKRSW